MNREAPQAVLFDKDGTLFDFGATWNVFAQRLLGRLAGGDPALAARAAEAVRFDLARGVFLPDSPNNLAAWQSADFAAALDAAKATSDEAESLAAMRAAEAVLMNDHVILPMYHRYNYMMMSSEVEGFWRSALNVPYFKDVTMGE